MGTIYLFFPDNLTVCHLLEIKILPAAESFKAFHFNIQIVPQKYQSIVHTYFSPLGIKISLNDKLFVSAIACDM